MPSSAARIKEQVEWCIRWEEVRAEYFQQLGDSLKADQCLQAAKELKSSHNV